MKRLLGALVLIFAVAGSATASEGAVHWDKNPVSVTDMAALQNGAKLFVNYCLNCHSANALRYNKLTELGLTEKQIEENLMFTGKKVGDLMHVAMKPEDAKLWMGASPPDLSVMARAKAENLGQPGTDYIYTYLRSFYRDQSRPTGWNNVLFPNVGMPNPLWQINGPVEVTVTSMHKAEKDGQEQWFKKVTKIDEEGFSTVVSETPVPDYKGEASQHAEIKYLQDDKKVAAFEKDVADLSAFMGWMAEPDQHFRQVLGTWVMLFLALFFVVAWFLNKSYWKYVK